MQIGYIGGDDDSYDCVVVGWMEEDFHGGDVDGEK